MKEYGKYVVTTTAKRKDAKRHIVTRCKTLEEARQIAELMNKKYKTEIYDGRWTLLETVSE